MRVVVIVMVVMMVMVTMVMVMVMGVHQLLVSAANSCGGCML